MSLYQSHVGTLESDLILLDYSDGLFTLSLAPHAFSLLFMNKEQLLQEQDISIILKYNDNLIVHVST